MGEFVIEAQQTGYAFVAGICKCGNPIPAIMGEYSANYTCPQCGKSTRVNVSTRNGMSVSLE